MSVLKEFFRVIHPHRDDVFFYRYSVILFKYAREVYPVHAESGCDILYRDLGAVIALYKVFYPLYI